MIYLNLIKDKETNERTFYAKGNKEDFKCDKCRKEIESGFLCENRNKCLCVDCQSKTKMYLCKHDDLNEHKHIKFIKANE